MNGNFLEKPYAMRVAVVASGGTVEISGHLYSQYLMRKIEELLPVVEAKLKAYREAYADVDKERKLVFDKYNAEVESFPARLLAWKRTSLLHRWCTFPPNHPYQPSDKFDWPTPPYRLTDALKEYETTLKGVHPQLTYRISVSEASALGIGVDPIIE